MQVNCFDILDEAPATTEGTLLAQAEKAQNCAPCVLLLRHVEALGRKSTGPRRGKGELLLCFYSIDEAQSLIRPSQRLADFGKTGHCDATENERSWSAHNPDRYGDRAGSDIRGSYGSFQARAQVGGKLARTRL